MGTNFYLVVRPPCPKCGDAGELIHIGKLSAGWAFHFRGYPMGAPDNPAQIPTQGITTFDQWRRFLLLNRSQNVRDEYDDAVALADLFEIVQRAKGGLSAKTAVEAQWGPTGRDLEREDPEGYRFTDREFS